MTMGSAENPTLLELPAEVILHILSYCSPVDLARVAHVCRRLSVESYDDRLWQALVNRSLPQKTNIPGPLETFRDLYICHHTHWFLMQHALWFSDTEPCGKLILTRYNAEEGCIEGHAVTARKGLRTWEFWEKDNEVMIHHFDPIPSVDKTRTVLKINVDSMRTGEQPNNNASSLRHTPNPRYSEEILMEGFADSGLYGSFMLCRTLPGEAIAENTQVWPPLPFPSLSRTRTESKDGFKSIGHRPTTLKEVSDVTFRLRKWVEYSGRQSSPAGMSFTSPKGLAAALSISGGSAARTPSASEFNNLRIRVPEDISTYAALPPSAYMPTPQKPYQGIWCGDYSGHGCEFLLVTQPDKKDERPLPEGMDWLESWLGGGSQPSENIADHESDDGIITDFGGAEASDPKNHNGEEFTDGSDNSMMSDDSQYSDLRRNAYEPTGRLEAIKLTGDPNIPRAEYTFIAPDIGAPGLMRVADEAPFKGARIVRSAGHMAGRGFRDDQFIAAQLIMVSHDTLAQFWEGFGHISYFKRVDLGALRKSY